MKQLCKTGFPIENYFELCATYILEYESIKQKQQFTIGNISENKKKKKANEDSNKGIELKLKISSYEQMLPVWVTKDQKITFTLKNLSVSSYNLTTHNTTNIYYQSEYPSYLLLARIGPSEDEKFDENEIEIETLQYHYFILTENNTQEYISPYTGPLFIMYNTEQPIIAHKIHHSITLIIKNAQYKTHQEIYRLLGLKYYHTQTEEEKNDSLINIINCLRNNPPLFANVFIKQISYTNKLVKELYDYLITLQAIPLLNYSNYIYEHIQMKAKTIVKTNPSPKASMITNIEPSLQNAITGLEECISLIKHHIIPLQIIISLLIDDNFPSKRNRNILINPALVYYASFISPLPSSSSSSDYFCIQEFCSSDTQMFT